MTIDSKTGSIEGIDDVVRRYPCPMCHRKTTLNESFRRGGKLFCGRACAEEFYFGADPDELDEDVDE